MPRKLKVFRMPIGFEDAYVAAPSRKAALQAWGASHDQFARGVAEEVTDPELMAEPLDHPGEVIRKSRGDFAAQLKQMPKRATQKAAPAKAKPAKPKPPPSRAKLDAAEAALKSAEEHQQAELARFEAQLDALHERHSKELAKLKGRRDAEREAYRARLEAWGG